MVDFAGEDRSIGVGHVGQEDHDCMEVELLGMAEVTVEVHTVAEVGMFEEHSSGDSSELAMEQLEDHDALGRAAVGVDHDAEGHAAEDQDRVAVAADHAEGRHVAEDHAVGDQGHVVDYDHFAIADQDRHSQDFVDLEDQELEGLCMAQESADHWDHCIQV